MNPQTQDENRDQPVYPSNPVTPVGSSPEADAAALQAIDALEAESDSVAAPIRQTPEPIAPIESPAAAPIAESTPLAGPTVAPADTAPTAVPTSGFQSPVENFTQPAAQPPVTPTSAPVEAPGATPAPAPAPEASAPFAANQPTSKKTPLIIAVIGVGILLGIAAGYLIWQAL